MEFPSSSGGAGQSSSDPAECPAGSRGRRGWQRATCLHLMEAFKTECEIFIFWRNNLIPSSPQMYIFIHVFLFETVPKSLSMLDFASSLEMKDCFVVTSFPFSSLLLFSSSMSAIWVCRWGPAMSHWELLVVSLVLYCTGGPGEWWGVVYIGRDGHHIFTGSSLHTVSSINTLGHINLIFHGQDNASQPDDTGLVINVRNVMKLHLKPEWDSCKQNYKKNVETVTNIY